MYIYISIIYIYIYIYIYMQQTVFLSLEAVLKLLSYFLDKHRIIQTSDLKQKSLCNEGTHKISSCFIKLLNK